MSILDDINEVPKVEEVPQAEQIEETQKFGIDLSILKAETGEGSINDYLEHPLNTTNSKGMAQVIRGFTGLFGALNLAIIDILVGLMNFTKEKKVVKDIVN